MNRIVHAAALLRGGGIATIDAPGKERMQAAGTRATAATASAGGSTIEFFTHCWCPFAHRVWLSLEDKSLPYLLELRAIVICDVQ